MPHRPARLKVLFGLRYGLGWQYCIFQGDQVSNRCARIYMFKPISATKKHSSRKPKENKCKEPTDLTSLASSFTSTAGSACQSWHLTLCAFEKSQRGEHNSKRPFSKGYKVRVRFAPLTLDHDTQFSPLKNFTFFFPTFLVGIGTNKTKTWRWLPPIKPIRLSSTYLERPDPNKRRKASHWKV